MSDLIPVLGGKPWEVIPNAEKTIAEQAARIKELEAERDALKVDAAKQFQAGHAAGLEAAQRLRDALAEISTFPRYKMPSDIAKDALADFDKGEQ